VQEVFILEKKQALWFAFRRQSISVNVQWFFITIGFLESVTISD